MLPVVQNRYAVQNQNLVRLLRTKIRRADSKETTFSEFGLLNVDSAFTDVPFGANLHGINGAALGDILHQYLLGIMKRLVINLLELIVSTTNPLILMKRKVKEKKKEDAAKREQLLADLSASKAASVMKEREDLLQRAIAAESQVQKLSDKVKRRKISAASDSSEEGAEMDGESDSASAENTTEEDAEEEYMGASSSSRSTAGKPKQSSCFDEPSGEEGEEEGEDAAGRVCTQEKVASTKFVQKPVQRCNPTKSAVQGRSWGGFGAVRLQ